MNGVDIIDCIIDEATLMVVDEWIEKFQIDVID